MRSELLGASEIVWKQLGTTGKNNFFFIAAQLRGIIKCRRVRHKPKSCFQKVVSHSEDTIVNYADAQRAIGRI